MKKIKNLEDLRAEKLRLQLELLRATEVLKEDFEWVKEEVKPFNSIGKFIGNLFGKNKAGLFAGSVGLSIDVLLKNLILAKSGWITRLIVPAIIKNLSTAFLADKKPEIFGVLRNLIQKARKSLHNEKEFYDVSTVDEMDY